jgi:hypothetical protein
VRQFYSDEGPLDTLLQIAHAPVWDGDLISKEARSEFVRLGWVARGGGYNVITKAGTDAIAALHLTPPPHRYRKPFFYGYGRPDV